MEQMTPQARLNKWRDRVMRAKASPKPDAMGTCCRCEGKFPTRTSGIAPGAVLCYDKASCDRNLKAKESA